MRTLIVRVNGTHLRELPARLVAAQVLPLARRRQCDRIRVVHDDGVRSFDFSVAQVERYVNWQGIALQPHRAVMDGVDIEPHRPVWCLRASAPDAETQEDPSDGPR